MSNQLSFATARKTGRGNLVAGWLAGGSIQVYTTPKPSTPDTAISSQTLLVTFTVPSPAGTVTSGAFTGAAIAQAQIAANGSAVWARMLDSSSGTIADVDVGVTGSNNFIELDSVALVQGGYVSVTSFGFTEG